MRGKPGVEGMGGGGKVKGGGGSEYRVARCA